MLSGQYSETGFEVVADNSLDLLVGTQAASAGMISANVRHIGDTFHADFGKIQSTITSQAQMMSDVNRHGFETINTALHSQTDTLTKTVDQGVGQIDQTINTGMDRVDADVADLTGIAATSVAVTAAGFALTAFQLKQLRGEVKAISQLGRELLEVQKLAQTHLESLVDYASRTLTTQEKILETLVNSRTTEAQQLIRQGWDNLKGGFDDDAFVRFEKSLDFDNTVYFTHAELARIYEKRGQPDKAEAHHRRAIAFAGGLNEETKGYALVQYAAFLERQKRLDDCIKQARTAVDGAAEQSSTDTPASSVSNQQKRSEKISSSSVGWRFYLAEMLVKSGDIKSGLAELQECIEQDARFFEAAMASSNFKTAQPALSQFLVKLDAERRAQVMRPLSQCEAPLKALEILAPDKGKQLQVRAAWIFEELLPAKFAALKQHEQNASALLAEIEAAIPIAVNWRTTTVENLMKPAVALANKQPELFSDALVVSIFAAAFMLFLAANALGTAAHSLWPFVIFILMMFGVGFFIRNTRETSYHQEMNAWKTSYAESEKAFETTKLECLQTLDFAKKVYASSYINDSISKLTALKIVANDHKPPRLFT